MPNNKKPKKKGETAGRKLGKQISNRSQFRAIEEVNKVLGAVVQFLSQRDKKGK